MSVVATEKKKRPGRQSKHNKYKKKQNKRKDRAQQQITEQHELSRKSTELKLK